MPQIIPVVTPLQSAILRMFEDLGPMRDLDILHAIRRLEIDGCLEFSHFDDTCLHLTDKGKLAIWGIIAEKLPAGDPFIIDDEGSGP